MSIESCYITNLPNEIIVQIFSELNYRELIINAMVCKLFSELTYNFKKNLNQIVNILLKEMSSSPILYDKIKKRWHSAQDGYKKNLPLEDKEIPEYMRPHFKYYETRIFKHISNLLLANEILPMHHYLVTTTSDLTKSIEYKNFTRKNKQKIEKWEKVRSTTPKFEEISFIKEEEEEIEKHLRCFFKKKIQNKEERIHLVQSDNKT